MHPERIKNIIKLSPVDRYEYSVREIVKHGIVWVFAEPEGLVTIVGPDGEVELLIWPHREVAELCAFEELKTETYTIEGVSLEDFLNMILDSLEKDRISIGVFFDDRRVGLVVPCDQIKTDLLDEID
jgi:hypothetical protein